MKPLMTQIKSLLFLSAGVATILLSCVSHHRLEQQGPINAQTVIATVDSINITLGEVLKQLDQLSTPGLSLDPTPENALNELIYRKLAYLSVDRYKDYDKDEIHRLAKNRTHDVLMQYMFRDLISDKTPVADSSVDSMYKAHITEYTIPERRRVTHLLISANPKAWEAAGIDVKGLTDQQLDAKAKDLIEEYYRQIQAGADIADLAGKYTHDTATKPKRGDSGLFKRGDMVIEFEKYAFKLSKGKISPPFKSIYGWHILRVDDIVDSTIRPLDAGFRREIYQQLKSAAENKLASQFVDSVAAKAAFVWNESLLQKSMDDFKPTEWICIVNGTDTIDAGMLKELELLYRTRSRPKEVTPETRKQLVMSKSMPAVLASVARQLGYADRDTIKQIYRDAYRQEIVNRIFRDRTPELKEPTLEEMKRVYQSHIDDFQSTKPLKVQQIIFKDSLEAASVKQELANGADFKDMAMKHYPGEPDFKEAAFDLGWISREEISPEFYDAAWVLDVGTIAGPVRTKWGYHLIKLIDRKQVKDFEGARMDVRDIIRKQEARQKSEQWVKWLMKGNDVVKYDDIIKQVDFSKPDYYFHVTDSLKKAAADTAASGS